MTPKVVPDHRGSGAMTALATPEHIDDLVTIDELGRRMRLSPKTLKQLGHKTGGLPLFRVTPHGQLYAFWPEVKAWMSKQRMLLSNGKLAP